MAKFFQQSIAASILLLALLNSSCQDRSSQVSLSIRTKTSEGEALPGATVKINGEAKGSTNAEGSFSTTLKLPIEQTLQISVEKQSDDFYYSPHEESFVVKDVAVQDISVAAILYFVPKPGNENETVAIGTQVDKTPETGDFDQIAPELKSSLNFPEQAKPSNEKNQAAGSPESSANVSEDISPLVAAEPNPENEKNSVAVAELTAKDNATQNGTQIFSIYTYFNKEDPIPNVKILIGEDVGELKPLCETNARGRCVAEFTKIPQKNVTLVAKSEGFITKSAVVKIKVDGSYRFELQPGHAIDFFALEKRFHRHKGIADTDIIINGKLMGKTNKFGHFTYKHPGSETDFISAEINTKGYLPETYNTDFVAAGEIQVTRSFTPVTPPIPSIAILPSLTAGDLFKQKMSGDEFQALTARIHKELVSAFNHQAAFKVVPVETVVAELGASYGNLGTLKDGWQKSSLDSLVDSIVIPTLIIGEKMEIEINLINSQGTTVAVAKESLSPLSENLKLSPTFDKLIGNIIDLFPFEGAVLKSDNENYIINLGAESSRGVRTGQTLAVYGSQLNKSGRGEQYREIAKLKITQTFSQESVAQVLSIEPRATIQRGDAVVLTRKPTSSVAQQVQIRVQEAKTQEPIGHANIYVNDQWIASTDNNGHLQAPRNIFAKVAIVKALKHGYDETILKTPANQGNLELSLNRKYSAMKINTQPAGANIFINGVLIGKSPIDNPIPVPNGFVTLEINAGDLYKRHKSTLEINHDIVDLSGDNKIVLEENLLAPALEKIKNNDVDTALNILARIPKDHSDYLFGQHQIGELMLSKRNDPEAAVAAFSKVLENQEVAKFINKQFIGTHINMALALYQLSERYDQAKNEQALQALGQVVQILDQVAPQLRFVSKDQYQTAKNNVDYYKTLAKHRVWLLTSDELVLDEVTSGWKDYIEEHKDNVNVNKSMLENANVYFKQALASNRNQRSSL